MQNKYVGDVGDFGKYGLLRALCKSGDGGRELQLGVVWYFTHEPAFQYLAKEDEFRACDNDLFDELARIARARTVATIESSAVLPPNAVFFSEPVAIKAKRVEWLDRAVARTSDCDLVFLDPDNGLTFSGDATRKHVTLEEVEAFAGGRRERSVIIYHHLRRESHDDLVADGLRALRAMFRERSVFALRFRPYFPRMFFVVSAPRDKDLLLSRARSLEKNWRVGRNKPYFQLF